MDVTFPAYVRVRIRKKCELGVESVHLYTASFVCSGEIDALVGADLPLLVLDAAAGHLVFAGESHSERFGSEGFCSHFFAVPFVAVAEVGKWCTSSGGRGCTRLVRRRPPCLR